MDIFYHKGIGDLFISNEQKKINDSMLKDAELQRDTQEAMLDYLTTRKAMASGDTASDQQTLVILAGMGILIVFTILMIT